MDIIHPQIKAAPSQESGTAGLMCMGPSGSLAYTPGAFGAAPSAVTPSKAVRVNQSGMGNMPYTLRGCVITGGLPMFEWCANFMISAC